MSMLVDLVIENRGNSKTSLIGERYVGDIKPLDDLTFPYVFSPDNLCRNGDNENYIYMLVLVKSRVNNLAGRDYIRNTWCQEHLISEYPMKLECRSLWVKSRCVFLLGVDTADKDLQRRVGKEANDHRDIVQGYFNDHYFNNTIKVIPSAIDYLQNLTNEIILAMGFKWGIRYCRQALYFAFIDDDFVFSPFNAISMLEWTRRHRPHHLTDGIIGFVYNYAMPIRHNSKWYISIREYAYSYWPSYCAAGTFFLTSDTAQRIEIAMRYTKEIRFDDVYLGIVAHRLSVPFYDRSDKLKCSYAITPKKIGSYVSIHTYGKLKQFHNLWMDHLAQMT